MQRVIDQLSETKDPKLFNKKINKLLDLFDKWEQNLIEREQHLLQNSKKLKNIQTKENNSSQKQHPQEQDNRIQQQYNRIKEHEKAIQKREAILLSDKQELENQLNLLKAREKILQKEREIAQQKENQTIENNQQKEYQINMKVQAISSRIQEKGNILQEKKNQQYERNEYCIKEKEIIKEEKELVMRQWDEVISQAQQIKLIEQENKSTLLQLRDIHNNIDYQNNILDKKYESLHQMHFYQEYKQNIDEKEQKIRLKEENIRLLQKELLNLRSLVSSKNSGISSNSSSQQNKNISISPAPRDSSTNNDHENIQGSQRQSSLNKSNLQIMVNSRNSTGGVTNQDQYQKQNQRDNSIPKSQPLQTSSSSSSISTNIIQQKAGSTSKVKQKFNLQNIKTDDSQIFSPISKHNPLSSFSGISPLHQNKDEMIIGGNHQTTKTINSGQNLCTVNDTKSDLTNKTFVTFDSSNYEYQKVQDKKRLFQDQIQDQSDLHIVEEKSYNCLSSLYTDSHQNSAQQINKNIKNPYENLINQNRQIQKGKQYFADQQGFYNQNDEIVEHQSFRSVVQNDNDRQYLQNLFSKKQQLLKNNQDEPNLSSNQQEDSINMTNALLASPSKIRISYNNNNSNEQDF